MRILFIAIWASILTFSLSNESVANGFTKKQINQYKNNCIAQNSSGLSSGAVKAYCTCMTNNVVSAFTPADVANPNESVSQRIRSTAQVPCLKYPVRNIIFNRCLQDKSVEIYSSQKENICNCVTDKSGQYISQRVAKIIAQSNMNTNWATVVVNDQDVNRNLTSNISLCVQSAGY